MNERIKELAEQAGFNLSRFDVGSASLLPQRIERFAELVRQDEREQWDTSDMAHRPTGLTVEQAEKQEPFGYFQLDLRMDAWVQNRDNKKGVPFYTAPPSKPWVGLTDEEIDAIYRQNHNQYNEDTTGEYERELEAKLKEKNGG
jgi:hypothetical protein